MDSGSLLRVSAEGEFPPGGDMRTKFLLLLGASLILVLAFSACNFPGGGGGTATSEEGVPVEPAVPAVPAEVAMPVPPANTDGAETILIPGATFWMGSDDSDTQAEADEMPRHQVTLGDFRIYTHEVTNAMYAACVEARACIPVNALPGGPTSHYGDPAFAEYPVSGVDWLMARDYCDWANGRLPTEAEWELASRGAESLLYPWGEEDPDCDRVNMSGCVVPPDTVRVGSYKLGNSPYEVWDLSGNVWEWVHDWYDEDAYFFSSVIDPLGPGFSETKVVRGGGLYSEPVMMRSAARQPANPNRPYDDVGFRCVAMPELALPEGYVPVDEVHERVAPDPLEGSGEHVEEADPDPDWFIDVGWIGFGCPSIGDMTMTFDVSASGPATATASVDGVPWPCGIDPASGLPTCEGAVPDGYGHSGTALVEWCIEVEGVTTCGAWTLDLPAPDYCEGRPGGSAGVRSFTCPVAGFFEATLSFGPPTVWDTIRLETSTGDFDIACVPVSDSEMICTFPDVTGEEYSTLYLHGTTADGGVNEHSLSFRPVWEDCPAESSIVGVFPLCYEGHPTAQVSYHSGMLTLASASADGAPRACIGTAPGVQICGDLPGDAGSPTTVTICFEGEPCEDRTLTVPDCLATETEIGFGIIPGCYPTLGPVVTINYSPAGQPLVSASADGSDLTCVAEPGPGLYMCHGIPGAPGSGMTITFCLADGSCFSSGIVVRDCEEEGPAEVDFRIAGLGCHDETHIFFIIDTGLEWLVPGAAYTYSAWDEDHGYACSVHPTIPGRLYCSGNTPDAPGRLQVCVDQDGPAPVMCDYFDDWPAQEATIPDCAPPPDVFSCSSILVQAACDADPRCRWEPKVFPSCIPR